MQRDGGGGEKYGKDAKSISMLRFSDLKGQKEMESEEKTKMKNK